MPRAMGTCAICGDEFIKVNKVRKYCTTCQGIRDVEYSPKRSRDCSACGTKFWPLKSNYTLCNPCREPFENEAVYGACRGCGKHLRPAPGLEAYCMSCVQSTEEKRLGWLRAVRKKRDARLEIS